MTVDLIDCMGRDETIVSAARISTSNDLRVSSEDMKLISFLMKNRHGSVFEHCTMQFRIECPIFVAREFMRHRIFSYNEQSGRYRELPPMFYVPSKERNLVQTGKAGAYTFVPGTDDQYALAKTAIESSSAGAYWEYQHMLMKGIAREVARMVLPLNIYTSFYATCNLRSLMNFLSLRSGEQGTYPSFPQAEIAMVAEGMENFFQEYFPVTHANFIKSGRVAP